MKLFAAIAFVVLIGLLAGIVPHQLGFRPLPNVHDEFGYLLEADTFARGRLTNPPHALPQYFQTVHQLTRPTYTAKFPPGLGLAMAVGQWLGDPIFGAFGSVAIGCGAIVWLIRAWLPIRWAIFGGLLATVHLTIQYWAQTFWGGGVTLFGGALLGGAVLRAARQLQIRYAVIAAVGVSILLISRPLEGVITAGLCGVFFLSSAVRSRLTLPDIGRFVVVGMLAMVPVIAFTAYYNWRVTGSVAEFPYSLYARQYQKAPLLLWQPVNAQLVPADEHFAQWREQFEFAEYLGQTTVQGYLTGVWNKTYAMAFSWLQPSFVLALLLLPLPWLLRWKKYRWLLFIMLGLPIIHMLITPWMRMHYLAPVVGFFFLLLAAGARQLSRWRLGALASVAILLYTAYCSGSLMRDQLKIGHQLGSRRQDYIDQLTQMPGNQVIVVDYTAGPQELFEWVFNGADIDSQKVIWARDLGPQTWSDLHMLYPDRQFWKLTVAYHTLDFRRLSATNL